MKNRYIIAALAAIYVLAGTLECPAATPTKPANLNARKGIVTVTQILPSAPVPTATYYRAEDIEAVKKSLREAIANRELLAAVLVGLDPAPLVFKKQAEAYDEALEKLEKLTPVTK